MEEFDFIDYVKKIDDRINKKCQDITVGIIENGKVKNWINKEDRKNNETNIGQNSKKLVIILESPHVKEYWDQGKKDDPTPAIGKTGKNLSKKLQDLIDSVIEYERPNSNLSSNKFDIILMNSIQYQCSLGIDTKYLRDKVFRKLWDDSATKIGKDKNRKTLNTKEDFINRLTEYEPDYIFNLCTKGNETKEESKIVENIKKKFNSFKNNFPKGREKEDKINIDKLTEEIKKIEEPQNIDSINNILEKINELHDKYNNTINTFKNLNNRFKTFIKKLNETKEKITLQDKVQIEINKYCSSKNYIKCYKANHPSCWKQKKNSIKEINSDKKPFEF